MEPSPLSRESFLFVANFLKEKSGYNLTEDKEYLLHSKLSAVAQKHRLESVHALIEHLKHFPHSELIEDIQRAMTVNESFFFREEKAFDYVVDELEKLYKQDNTQTYHIWSAACSNGQEPYSIAMKIEASKARFPALKYAILATDINTHVIEKAHNGVYLPMEADRGLPDDYKQRFFIEENNCFRIKDHVKQSITFKHFNLCAERYLHPQKFNIILLRNVMIYFDDALKRKVILNMADTLHMNGKLLLSGTEIMPDGTDMFRRCDGINFAFEKKQ